MDKERAAQPGYVVDNSLCADNHYICFESGIVKGVHIPGAIGYLQHEETNTKIPVYVSIGLFKRLMLKWCFGLKYKKYSETKK